MLFRSIPFIQFNTTAQEALYVHPLADGSGRRNLVDRRRPIPVTGGLVGVDNPRVVVPIVWQVYDNQDIDPNTAGIQYPNYNYPNPLDPAATDRWAFLMERFAWDWDWAVDFATGHFAIAIDANGNGRCDDPREGGDQANNCWKPTAGYRTLLDTYTNLGGFPGPREANGTRIKDKLLQGASPIYVYFGANFAGKPFQTNYTTNKITLEFTE